MIRSLGWLLGVLLVAANAHAQAPASSELDRAKDLFRKGNELRRAGDCERALVFFLRSRELVPSVPNVLNAAHCLNLLGRHDEALEHYETLLTDFRSELRPEELEQITAAMRALRAELGSLEVVANVTGALLIVSGRPRGQLPQTTPVRALPGEQELVVVKDGYESFRTQVKIEPGRLTRVSARLLPLRIAGRLRIDHPSLTGAELIVDGAPVGRVPWEGVLAPGRHWISVRQRDHGSKPTSVVVVAGQTALATPVLEPLGPPLDVAVEPASAEIALGDVALGRGRWRGRLPRGTHRLELRAEGFVTETRTLRVTENEPRSIVVRMRVDREHPRWGLARGHFGVDVLAGVALTPGFGSGIEASCDAGASCSENGLGIGILAGARAGFEFPSRLSLELVAGYASLRKRVRRAFDTTYAATTARFELSDELALGGPLLAGGVSYRVPLMDALDLRVGIVAGAMLVSARDEVRGEATAHGERTAVGVPGSGESVESADLFVMPDVGAAWRFGSFRVGLGVLVPIFVLQGPDNAHGQALVSDPGSCPASGDSVHCAPSQALSERERAYGRFVWLVPVASAGLVF